MRLVAFSRVLQIRTWNVSYSLQLKMVQHISTSVRANDPLALQTEGLTEQFGRCAPQAFSHKQGSMGELGFVGAMLTRRISCFLGHSTTGCKPEIRRLAAEFSFKG